MSTNLIDAAKGFFTDELIEKAAAYLGESETSVAKAVTGIIPAILGGILNKTANYEGAGVVARMVEDQYTKEVLHDPGIFFGNEGGALLNKSAGFLNNLYGNKTDGITNLVSNFAGIKPTSSTTLLCTALPAVLGLLGKYAEGGDRDVAALVNSQKDNIAAAVPQGLNLGGVLGNWGGGLNNLRVKTGDAQSYATAPRLGAAVKMLLALLVIGVVIGAWYLFHTNARKM